MNPDDTLRDALRDDVGNGATANNAWERVRARAATIQHRRRIAQRSIAALTAAAMIAAVLVAAGAFRNDDRVIATNPPAAQIVAVQGPNTGTDRLVVLSADDGHVIRTLADNIGITFGGISATPDGETVYFARRRTALPCDRIEIAKVPSTGGPVEVIGPGIHPLVSPDGRTLVYSRSSEADPCGPRREIVWRDLETGAEEVVLFGDGEPQAWAPDSTRFAVATSDGGEWWSGVVVLRAGPPAEAMSRIPLNLPAPADGATYLRDGRLVVALEFQEEPDGGQLHRLVAFDDIGEPTETLLESRQNGVLHITANGSGELLLHFGGSLLQRWRPGDAEPTTITDDIRDAAWLPTHQSAPPEPPTTTTTTLAPVVGPDQMVVARSNGRLDAITADGTVIRRLGSSGHDVPWIAVAPDGKAAYYEQGTIDACDDAGEIDALRLDVYPPHFSGGYMGSWSALSPDGTKLAYRSGPCGGDLVVLDLSTEDRMVFSTGGERTWSLASPNDGGPGAELVGPVGWDADNQHLMLRVNREPTTEFWYVDTTTAADAITGTVFRTVGEPGTEQGPSNFAPLGSSGRWAAVFGTEGGARWQLVEYDVTTSTVVRTLVELPDPRGSIAGVDASGRNVLVLIAALGRFDLYRWSEGETSLTLVAKDITAADW